MTRSRKGIEICWGCCVAYVTGGQHRCRPRNAKTSAAKAGGAA